MNEPQPSQKNFNHYITPLTAAVICFFFFSLSSPAAFAQDFSSIDNDLQTLEFLINANSDSSNSGN
ncbi:hypothetical protein [Treponema sp. R80B11-R83G3]